MGITTNNKGGKEKHKPIKRICGNLHSFGKAEYFAKTVATKNK